MKTIKKYATGAYIALIAIAGAVIYALLGSNDKLKGKVAGLEIDKKQSEDTAAFTEAEKVSDDSEKDYNATRDQYIRNRGSDGSTDEH